MDLMKPTVLSVMLKVSCLCFKLFYNYKCLIIFDPYLVIEEGVPNVSGELLVEPSGNKSAILETAFNPEKCPLGELLCISDRSCIKFEQLCDGANDCSDGADETDCSSDE